MYTDDQLIEMYTERRYKRWVKQKLKLRFRLILIVLLLLINIVLVLMLLFNRDECECSDVSESDCLVEGDTEEYITGNPDTDVNSNAIPGRYAFLTFDDGPSAHTGRILDVLNERNAPAIFFVLGQSINNRWDAGGLLNRMLNEGHYIGLHTMTHDFNTLYVGEDAPGRFVNEMFELNELINGMIGSDTNLCRAAYGMAGGTFTPEHHAAVAYAGLYCIDWNVDSRDWYQRTTYMVYQNVTNQIERLDFPNELVILFHEFSWTADALAGIIDYLRFHGYTIAAHTPGHRFAYYRYRH